MKKHERLYMQMNDTFRDHLKKAMAEKGVAIESFWNFAVDRLVTTTIDGKDMTPKQMEFLKGFSEGYMSAMKQIYPFWVKP